MESHLVVNIKLGRLIVLHWLLAVAKKRETPDYINAL